jgi:hypothetical protein
LMYFQSVAFRMAKQSCSPHTILNKKKKLQAGLMVFLF